MKADGFVDKVKEWWASYHFTGTPCYVLANKLKALKYDLKRWNETQFGNIVVKKNQAVLDLEAEHMPFSSEERAQRDSLVADIEHFTLMDKISWRQKSKALQSKEGDKTPNFSIKLQTLIVRPIPLDNYILMETFLQIKIL